MANRALSFSGATPVNIPQPRLHLGLHDKLVKSH